MFPYALGFTTLLHGFYSLLWIVILLDVGSPTLDLRSLPNWPVSQALVLAAALSTLAAAIGVVMHTLSHNVFRRMKDNWNASVLTSQAVRRRAEEVGSCQPCGGPSLLDIHAAEGHDQLRMCREFMHALEYALMSQAPHMHSHIKVYRDQYRLARGFILPSLIFAFVLPFWEPVPAGHVGAFPLISLQLFFLGVFFAGVCMYAYRERSFRYAAARVRCFLTLRAQEKSATQAGHLTAVG